jgi:hypothetical protein
LRRERTTVDCWVQLYEPYRPDGNQCLLRYGPNELGGNPKALFKWASSRTSHNLLMVSRCDSERSESTRSTARNANVVSASLLRSKADRMEGEPMSSRNRETVAASVRLCLGGKFLAQQNLRHLEGLDDDPIRVHAKTKLTRLFGLVNSASCYLFREWAEWPLERPPVRSGVASIARFARTRRRSSTYRGTSTTKNSPFASEKITRATPGSSLEMRVSAAFASNRWCCLGVAITFL